jgi:regulator of cell morphogenesis and NO signaling
MPTIAEHPVTRVAGARESSFTAREKLGLDYCCGGKSTLTDARLHADVDEPDTDVTSPAWNERPLRDLIAHIVATQHVYIRNEIPRLEALLAQVVTKHGAAHPELTEISQLFLVMARELSSHLTIEEQSLFPRIERMEQAVPRTERTAKPAFFLSVKRPLSSLTAERANLAALLLQMAGLSDGYRTPGGACPAFEALYQALKTFERNLRWHLHLENSILFPRAVALEKRNTSR